MSNNDNRSPFRSRPLQNPNPNNQHPFSPFSHSINGSHQPLLNQQQLGFQDLTPSQTMSFRDFFHRSVDYNSVSEAFEMSFFPSEVMEDHHHGNPRVTTQQQQRIVSSPVNYSISSSSEGDRDRKISKEVLKQNGQDLMGSAEDLGKSKKGTKSKMKEKAVKEAKFAFLTKSEVDHLEDGYRWRKYGQKAVKNSSYPRSYYRCTSPKCPVKKQIERSQHDPTIVITTYEGQHNHGYPSNIRGCAGTADPFFGTSFGSVMARQDIFPRQQLLLSQTLVSQKPAFQEHGIMQDIDPFRVRKSELR